MFKGNYNFFDYKYNISGYNGQDFGSIMQYLYLIISIILIIILLIIFRKTSKEKVIKITRVIGIFLIVIYLGKTIWESIYDIKLTGSFNTGLLPFDTCSIIMYATLLAGFTKGKFQELSLCWLATGGIVGGLSTMVVLNAFKYYPFFSFGAFYSMIWHFLMVFLGLLIIVTKAIDLKYSMVIKGFMFHSLISMIIIPINYIYDFDFMLYHYMGSIPFFEEIGSKLIVSNLAILNPLIMLLLYFISFNLIYFISLGVSKIFNRK